MNSFLHWSFNHRWGLTLTLASSPSFRSTWATSWGRWDFSGTAWFRPRSASTRRCEFKGKKTGRLMCPLSLCFQDQYLFCYKVWLEVLQGILQLHGNQWQPESPQDHKVVWAFSTPGSVVFVKHTTLCSPSLHWRVTPDSWAVVSDSFRDLKTYKKTLYSSVFTLCIEA